MDRHTIIFVTDQRQQNISDFLPGRAGEWLLHTGDAQNKTLSEELEQHIYEGKKEPLCRLAQMIRTANCIVLPTPVLKIDKLRYIKEIVQENLRINKEEDVVSNLMVFGGKFSQEWKDFFLKYEISYIDFMEEDSVTERNAQVTAEAAIAELLKQSNYSIENEKYVVTGYGNCGKAIADKLSRLGAKVTILARSAAARKEAKQKGFCATDFAFGPEEMYGTRGVINTVPACVVTEAMIKEMHKDAVILDIASKPGGVERKAAAKYEIPVIPALGLPGVYTTKTSAKILADSIRLHTLPKIIENKEEKSWIFQIII